MTTFNLFRVNCLINDSNSNTFKKTIISIISEYFYETNNSSVDLEDIYRHLVENLGLQIDFDFLVNILENPDLFELTRTNNSFICQLTSLTFEKVKETISTKSIEYFINEFLEDRGYSKSFFDSIMSLLFSVVSENINSFSSEKIIQILSLQGSSNNKFTKEDISIFNEFLEFENGNKNRVLYSVFQKAIEFAILTSGKGVSTLSPNLFNNKKYLLDTNIIFRILGVGGEERQSSLIALLKECIAQGISIEYSTYTYQELRNKLNQIVKYLKSLKNYNEGIDTLANMYLDNPALFDGDFITHYASLKKKQIVNSPDEYEQYIRLQLMRLEKEIGYTQMSKEKDFSKNQIEKFANTLLKNKKKLKSSSRYTITSAKIDAYNILQVREFRGQNNFNYSDVKSFYLTTDRNLNKILRLEENILIPETILPSQLFILHHNLLQNHGDTDIDLFIRFVKKRTSTFSFKGKDVLDFHSKLIQKGILDEDTGLYIKNCLNIKYEKEPTLEMDEMPKTSKAIIDYVIGQKLKEGEDANSRLSEIREKISQEASKIYYRTKLDIKIIDTIITIVLLPALSVLIKQISNQGWPIFFTALVILEILKMFLSSRFKLINKLWYAYLKFKTENSAMYELENYELSVMTDEFYNNIGGDVWGKE